MTPVSIAVLSLSMSADAFAAAVGRGAAHRPSIAGALRSSFVFGLIEMVTPVIGWSLGLAAAGFVEAVDHWIAFGLLGAIGTKMSIEAIRRRNGDMEVPGREPSKSPWVLIGTAIGTSIDAAAVGVTLAFLKVSIVAVAASIGLATFIMASIGMLIGRAAGNRLGSVVELLGGLALIGIGTTILLEHLGYL